MVLAERAASRRVGAGAVAQIDRGIQPDEARRAVLRDDASRLDGGADGACLAAVRVDDDLSIGHAPHDVVDLCLYGGEVVLGAALQDELPTELTEARDLHDVLPNVLGQHHRQTGKKLLARKTLFLEVDAIGIQEHRASIAELRRQLGRERDIGVVANIDVELIGHRLQQHAVAGRALVREPEVLHFTVLKEQHLDVLTADVADDVDIGPAEVRRALHMGHGLDDVGIGAQRTVEHFRGIAGGAQTEYLEVTALLGDKTLDAREDVLRVLQRISLRQSVGLEQQFSILVEQHPLRARRAAIETNKAAHRCRRLKHGWLKCRHGIASSEAGLFISRSGQRRARRLPQPRCAAVGQKRLERLRAAIGRPGPCFLHAKYDGAVRRIVLCVIGHRDQPFYGVVRRGAVAALRPGLGYTQTPAFLEKGQVRVRTTQQQDARPQRIAPRQHREVLHNDRVGQRIHHLRCRDARLGEVDDVRLGKNTAFGSDVMKLSGIEMQRAELVTRHADLENTLVDGGACSRCTFVVHRRDHPSLAGSGCVLEEDDLGILTAEFDDAVHLRMQTLHRERYGVDLLHEPRTHRLGERPATRTGDKGADVARTIAELRLHLSEHLDELVRLTAVVSLIAAPDHLHGGWEHDDALDGGRADVDADEQAAVRRGARCDGAPLILAEFSMLGIHGRGCASVSH